MIKSIRHLRGTKAEWNAFDPVIPDGEIAILKSDGGIPRIKIGNGRDKFSTLAAVTGGSVVSAESAVTLYHGISYRLGERAELHLSIPDSIDDDYYSEVTFDSGEDATELYIDRKIRLTGDGVADEELMPRSNTHYTVFIWYDGELQGIVRGLPNA